MRRFWLLAALALMGGYLWPLGMFVLAPAAVVGVYRARLPGALVALWAALFISGASAAMAEAAWRARRLEPPRLPALAVVETVDLAGDGVRVRLVFEASLQASEDRARLRLDTRPPGLAPGARVLVTGLARRPDPPDNPGSPDFLGYCESRRVRWVIQGDARVVTPADALSEGVVRAREAARTAVLDTPRPDGSALLLGLLLGDQSLMPAWAVRAFEATGTGHLLSVSGVHISGVALLVFALSLIHI